MASFARLMTMCLAVLLAAAVLPAVYAAQPATGGSTATMEKNGSATKAGEAADDRGKFVGLLEYTAIQNALGLDENQKKQIADANRLLDDSVPDPHAFRDLPAKQRQIKLHAWETKAQQLKEKLGRILTPDQVRRLKEIALQLRLKMRASSLLAEKELAEKLSLSQSQKQELKSLRQRIREQISKARQALVQTGRETGQITEEKTAEKTRQFRKQFRELRDKAHKQALDILSPEQKKKLSGLTGKAADINVDDLLTEQSARVEKWASRWKKQRDAAGKKGQAEAKAQHPVGTTVDEGE